MQVRSLGMQGSLVSADEDFEEAQRQLGLAGSRQGSGEVQGCDERWIAMRRDCFVGPRSVLESCASLFRVLRSRACDTRPCFSHFGARLEALMI